MTAALPRPGCVPQSSTIMASFISSATGHIADGQNRADRATTIAQIDADQSSNAMCFAPKPRMRATIVEEARVPEETSEHESRLNTSQRSKITHT